ncbi:MAG TPA: hypothetical protein VNB30_05905 [Rhizomicrobium sp.]|nr:hypothetical protein [Rhizomicrobium sp.]
MRNNLLERAVFREEVGSARYDDQFLGPAELSICLFVEFDNAMIFAADNEKRRRPHRQQDAIGKIRPAPARNDCADLFKACRCDECCGGTCTCPEESNRKTAHGGIALRPPDGLNQPVGQQRNLKNLPSVVGIFFLRLQQVEKQCCDAAPIQRFRNHNVARAQPA